jgi:hypothetical protein
MFGAPSEWTPVSKTCPGTIRIRRFNQTVLPAIVAGSTGGGGLSVADANSLERHLDVIQRKVETTFNQVNSNDAALSSELDGISAQVSQADMTGSSRRSASPRPEGRPARAGYLGPRCSRNQSRAAPLAASNALT